MNTFFRRNLPHYYVPNAVYFITFRLAGSLPAEAIARAEEIYEAHLRRLDQTLSGAERVAARYRAQKQHFARVDTLLDQAKYGPRWLAKPECARIVAGCIHELDSTFYHLHAYCIMPNHVHLLIDVHNIPEPPPRADGRTFTALSQAMQRLKGKSAVLCNRLLGRRGPFWQHESYDHVVRNAEEYERILVYILNNPVKANLVDNWEQRPYTYVNAEQAEACSTGWRKPMEFALLVNILAAGVRSGTPILFATIGEIFAERAGVLNLGVEGMMLMGAMTAFGVAHATGNPWLGLLVAMSVGGLLALLHAFATVTLQADQVVSGLALTFLGTGLSAVLGAPLVQVRQAPRLPTWHVPGLADIPVLGQIFFQHNIVVYLGFLLVPLAWFYLYRTRWGLELRAVGEYPAAADVLGVNVFLVRYVYVVLGGVLAGMAGAALSLAITPLWIEGMTAGQGWIAVGLVIFAGWDPVRAAFGAYLFGAIRRLPLDMQSVAFFLRNPTYGYFLNMLPYLFTIVVLVIGSREALRRRVGAPAALGIPYVREERGA